MGRDEIRAGDVDRQAVADRLRVAVDEGRLNLHEYDERLQLAYAAKTYGDLDPLVADLPGADAPGAALAERSQPAPAGAAPTATDARYPDATRRWLAETWGGYAGVVAICVAVWLATALIGGELGYFWPVWVIGPWGLVLVLTTIGGLMNGEPQRWAGRQERRAQRRAAWQEERARRRAAWQQQWAASQEERALEHAAWQEERALRRAAWYEHRSGCYSMAPRNHAGRGRYRG